MAKAPLFLRRELHPSRGGVPAQAEKCFPGITAGATSSRGRHPSPLEGLVGQGAGLNKGGLHAFAKDRWGGARAGPKAQVSLTQKAKISSSARSRGGLLYLILYRSTTRRDKDAESGCLPASPNKFFYSLSTCSSPSKSSDNPQPLLFYRAFSACPLCTNARLVAKPRAPPPSPSY